MNIKLYVVGSRGRMHENPNDQDYITTTNLNTMLDIYQDDIKTILKHGDKFISYINNDEEQVDIWRVKPKYLKNNLILRTMDRGHYIALARAIKKIGYGHLSFDGVHHNGNILNIRKVILENPQLYKFKKYLK